MSGRATSEASRAGTGERKLPPYGYYALVSFAAMAAFSVMAYQYWNKKQQSLAVAFEALALPLQPFAKITLGCTAWNTADVTVTIPYHNMVAGAQPPN